MTGNELVIADPANASLEQIQPLMADRHGPYWSGPRATALQARAATLYKQRHPEPAEVIPAADVPDAGAPSGRWLAEEWNKAGGVKLNEAAARDVVAGLDAALPPNDRDHFNGVLAALSPTVRHALLLELSGALPRISGTDATPDQLTSFGDDDTGRALVRMWGNGAARKLGHIRGRIGRIKAMLRNNPDAVAEFRALLESMPGGVFIAIAGKLTEGA